MAKFICVWDAPTYEPKRDVVTESFFTEANGFTKDDIDGFLAMNVDDEIAIDNWTLIVNRIE